MKTLVSCMKRLKGFTLTELIITIAVIVILSTISVPLYQDYTYKTKMAEGYLLLSAIHDAQLRYYNEYGIFIFGHHGSAGGAQWTCNDEVLGINARPNKYYTWFTINPYNGVTDAHYSFMTIARGNGVEAITMKYNMTTSIEFA